MNWSIPVVGFLVMLGVVGCDSGLEEVAPESKASIVEGNNAFGYDLYHQLQTKKGNLFFSPYSISTALSMTYAGARGQTAQEMAHVLHLLAEQDKQHPGMAAVVAGLAGQKDGVRLDVANALWGQKGQPFVADFLQLTKRYYGAGFHTIDFHNGEAARQEINAWVEKQTQDKIKDLLGPNSVDNASLVLTNAIYFKGDWLKPFAKGRTFKESFLVTPENQVKVDMMHLTDSFSYMEDDNFQALSLPYKGEAVSLIAFLPRTKDGLSKLEEQFKADMVNEALAKMKKSKVIVSLPKFKMTSTFELADVLSKMGMPLLFQPGKADLSGIVASNDLFISRVVHKAYVDVYEEGTEAAAATAVIAVRASAARPPSDPIFRADHPFVIAIRDNKTGSLLFLGRVANPKE
ncbi:serpin family protein [soil metagenome]